MPHLPERWAQHLESGTTQRVGACGSDGLPQICRALAARACDDGSVEVLLAADVGRHVIAAVQATGRVAHVAVALASGAALQLKGMDAQVLPARSIHLEVLARNRDRLLAGVAAYGVAPAQVNGVWYDVELPLLRCLRYTPCEATDQTPGASAGRVELQP